MKQWTGHRPACRSSRFWLQANPSSSLAAHWFGLDLSLQALGSLQWNLSTAHLGLQLLPRASVTVSAPPTPSCSRVSQGAHSLDPYTRGDSGVYTLLRILLT